MKRHESTAGAELPFTGNPSIAEGVRLTARFGPLRAVFATIGLLAASAMIISACNGENGEEPENDDFCMVNADCPEGEECLGGACMPKPPKGCEGTGCDEHSFCAPDAECKRSGEWPCEADEDCGEGFFCSSVLGYCLQHCETPSDCSPELTCDRALGGCIECAFDSQCEGHQDGEYCLEEEGLCVGCLEPSHCGANSFCDLGAESETVYTCREGCLQESDCGEGSHCDRPGSAPGRCVECSPATAYEDCTDRSRPRCHPSLLQCVECFEHGQCGDQQYCHPEKFECVSCLQSNHCPMGSVCVAEDSVCEPGCDHDDRCPPEDEPDLIYCDTERGALGECVECLSHDHCESDWVDAYMCEDGVCVPGCESDADCKEDAMPRCLLTERRCVRCLSDDDCPDHLKCDPQENACRCIDPTDNPNICSTSDQCGNPGHPPEHWYDMGEECVPTVVCAAQVNCGGDWRNFHGSKCTEHCGGPAGDRSDCPYGFCCRVVRDVDGVEQRFKCVENGECGGVGCRD